MTNLSRESLISIARSFKKGTIVRIAYSTELPVKSEFKKAGYMIHKLVETSVRIGVNYGNIASVIARKAQQEVDGYESRKTTNNYVPVVENLVYDHSKTEQTYLQVANLPHNSNTHSCYVIVGADGSSKTVEKLSDADKNLVRDSYFKPSSSYVGEIRRIKFDNILFLGNSKVSIGSRVF